MAARIRNFGTAFPWGPPEDATIRNMRALQMALAPLLQRQAQQRAYKAQEKPSGFGMTLPSVGEFGGGGLQMGLDDPNAPGGSRNVQQAQLMSRLLASKKREEDKERQEAEVMSTLDEARTPKEKRATLTGLAATRKAVKADRTWLNKQINTAFTGITDAEKAARKELRHRDMNPEYYEDQKLNVLRKRQQVEEGRLELNSYAEQMAWKRDQELVDRRLKLKTDARADERLKIAQGGAQIAQEKLKLSKTTGKVAQENLKLRKAELVLAIAKDIATATEKALSLLPNLTKKYLDIKGKRASIKKTQVDTEKAELALATEKRQISPKLRKELRWRFESNAQLRKYIEQGIGSIEGVEGATRLIEKNLERIGAILGQVGNSQKAGRAENIPAEYRQWYEDRVKEGKGADAREVLRDQGLMK